MEASNAEFTRLWTAALPTVAAFVGSMVHDPSDRDDVLQDCAVASMTSYGRYDASRPFLAWAIGIARNQVRLYLRRKTKDPHLFDDSALDALVQSFSGIKRESHLQLARLEHCVGQLEGRARQLCEYRYTHDLKPAAIAAKLGMSANAVAKALQRVRDQLRECIERQTDPAR